MTAVDEPQQEPTPATIKPTKEMLYGEISGMGRFRPPRPGHLEDESITAMLDPICTARRRERITARAFVRLSGEQLRDFCTRYSLPPVHVAWAQAIVEASWAMHRLRRLSTAIGGPRPVGGMQ